MFIQTEPTPNPATLKFIPGEAVMGANGTRNYTAVDQAEASPLARKLFDVEGVKGVFLGTDFVTITKVDELDWQVLKPQILGGIMEHYTSGQPVLDEKPEEADAAPAEEEDELVTQIKELLDTRVRPAVAQDGGDIIFHEFKEGTVYLQMHGSCSGCPSSTATLKMGIENMLRYYVPEVQAVEPVYLD